MRSTTWQQAVELQLPSFWPSSCPRPCALLACVPLAPPLLATCCFRTLAWTLKVLLLASGSFCSRSRAQLAATATLQVSGACGRNDDNAAGQRRVRAQVASDFYPVSISCGCRVSCAETLLVDGVLARRAVRARSEPAARLIFSPCLDDLPEKHTISELFAGFSRHI